MSDLILKTQRAATAEEVSSLIHGTGALSWSWWGDVAEEERDGVNGYLFTHDTEDDEEGAFSGRTWVTEQQILDAAGRFIAEGRLVYDVADVMTESIGYLDAADADIVLQYAVLGKSIFG